MIRKLKAFCEKMLATKMFFSIGLIFFFTIALFIGVTKFEVIHDTIVYPEEEYCLLEAEAERLVSNRTFETEYSYEITATKNKNENNINMTISEGMANVYISYENFGADDEIVSIKRGAENTIFYVVCWTISVIMFLMLIALTIEIVLYIPILILSLLVCIIDKILTKKSKVD